MIYSLNGKILEKGADRVVIECGGVGYEVRVPLSAASALPAQGSTATLYTFLNITENDISLFGFLTAADRQMFQLLTSVSGVGPKVGLAILSALPCDRVALAISAGDAKAFTAASGVGPKLGQRIVLELKDKVGKGLAGEIPAGMSASPLRFRPAAQRRRWLPSVRWATTRARRRRRWRGWIRRCRWRSLSDWPCARWPERCGDRKWKFQMSG